MNLHRRVAPGLAGCTGIQVARLSPFETRASYSCAATVSRSRIAPGGRGMAYH